MVIIRWTTVVRLSRELYGCDYTACCSITVSGWTDVAPLVKISNDLKAHPLQIKTDSVVGSEEAVYVRPYTDYDYFCGPIMLIFSNPPTYYIGNCNRYIPFPVTLPVEQAKVWTITQTDTALKVECNDVEVLNYSFSESAIASCLVAWSHHVKQIDFYYDTASDGYRQQPGMEAITTSLQCINYIIYLLVYNWGCHK